jgi:hypothetical protein
MIIIIMGEVVHSYNYYAGLKRNSYTVKLSDGRYYQVVTFVVGDIGSGDNCYAIGRHLPPVPFNLFASCNLKLSHITAVSTIPSALIDVPAADIIVKKCVFVSVNCGNAHFVCDQVYSIECCM